MKRNILEEIANVPANEYIPMQKWDNDTLRMRCPFCGAQLRRYNNGLIGREKMTWYDDCTCKAAKAAAEHNAKIK